jgi:hypothetical protein
MLAFDDLADWYLVDLNPADLNPADLNPVIVPALLPGNSLLVLCRLCPGSADYKHLLPTGTFNN